MSRTKKSVDTQDSIALEVQQLLANTSSIQLAVLSVGSNIEVIFDSIFSKLAEAGIEEPAQTAVEIMNSGYNNAMLSAKTRLGALNKQQTEAKRIGFRASNTDITTSFTNSTEITPKAATKLATKTKKVKYD